MARKKPKTYTAEELVDLKKRIHAHAENLIGLIQGAVGAVKREDNWDAACQLRDNSQLLVTTLLVLKQFSTVFSLASHTGEPQQVPYLDECGMEDV